MILWAVFSRIIGPYFSCFWASLFRPSLFRFLSRPEVIPSVPVAFPLLGSLFVLVSVLLSLTSALLSLLTSLPVLSLLVYLFVLKGFPMAYDPCRCSVTPRSVYCRSWAVVLGFSHSFSSLVASSLSRHNLIRLSMLSLAPTPLFLSLSS